MSLIALAVLVFYSVAILTERSSTVINAVSMGTVIATKLTGYLSEWFTARVLTLFIIIVCYHV